MSPRAAAPPQVAALLAERLADGTMAEDEVAVGFGFRDSTWESAPTAEALDAVTGNRAVVLISGDVHSVWMNSAAIAHFGLGETDGLLREDPAFALQQRLQQVPDEVLDGWVAEAAGRAAAMGVAGIVDFTMDWNIGHWQRRFANGFDSLSVRAATYPALLDQVRLEGLRGGQLLGTKQLQVGPLKVISDGSLGSGTAWCHQPYGGSVGQANVDHDELVHLLAQAATLGMWSAVHAIGDRAMQQALDAFAESGAPGAIEHAQLVHPGDIARMARLGLRASVQPAHLLDDRDTMDQLWADRSDHAFPLRSLVNAGVPLAFGSDAPVSPLDPWLAIEAAVRRSGDDRDAWHPEQCLDLGQALLASTRGVAELVVGAEADLILLPDNPFEFDPTLLHTVRPVLTMVGGHITCDKL